MPRLSDTMTEGVLSRWVVQEGGAVKKGDVLAEIETDKATMDLEAFDAGVLERQLVPEGTVVPIGEPVAVIGDGSGAGKDAGGKPDAGGAQPTAGERAAGGQAAGGAQPAGPQPTQASASPAGTTATPAGGRILTSPLARRLATEHRVDLSRVTGTGPGGRVVRADIEAAIASQGATETAGRTAGAAGPAGPAAAPAGAGGGTAGGGPAPASTTDAGAEEVPLSTMRRVTARRLSESAAAPHFFLTNIVRVDRLLAFRAEVNAGYADSGTKVSVTDLLVRACAVTLRSHPQVNSSWGGDKILRHRQINIGVAVAVDEGLMVPVVAGADGKGLDAIAAQTRDLAAKARAGRLSPAEFSGGTFTISNLGMFGIDNFTAVINPPEAAILAVGAATEDAFVEDGQLRSHRIMKITLTSDHRVLDGAVSAAFLQDLKRTLEEPVRMLL
jgi:pyruvate dehydrogenase E2 component (dihydrolipoamide acetyltransferase)